MVDRKNLTITQVEEIKKVGDKQIPKLSFKAKDGDKESMYFTFRSSLFDLIKVGQTINVDLETSTREYDGNTYTDRRVVQIYIDGQPIAGKGQQGYRGKSPEELDQTARTMSLSYAKDLAVADKIAVVEVINQADIFYNWVKKSEPKVPEPKPEKSSSSKAETLPPPSESKGEIDWSEENAEQTKTPSKIQNITEFKGLMSKHKVATHDAYEILSIKSFMELTDLDEAWDKIKKAKKI